MRIHSNTNAFNAYRNLGIHNNRIAKAMERLSSGNRINGAGDDPAGLAVSEKLKAQLTRLETDKKNAIDYQSALQVADGSLSEVQSMLKRMTELADMAANGTYTDQDRAQLDKEYQQLLDEINRIGDSSTFNDKKLFGSDDDSDSPSSGTPGNSLISEIVIRGDGLNVYLDGLDKLMKDISEAAKAGDNDKLLSLGIDRSNGKSDSENLQQAILDYTAKNSDSFSGDSSDKTGARYTLKISGDEISVDLYSVGDKELGLEGSSILTQEGAKKASDSLKKAINQVSSQRGSIGATYNRLEHTINNISSMEGNLTDALSRIMDADMAAEMMVLVKEQMLAQASTFALAQANQEPKQVIALLNSM